MIWNWRDYEVPYEAPDHTTALRTLVEQAGLAMPAWVKPTTSVGSQIRIRECGFDGTELVVSHNPRGAPRICVQQILGVCPVDGPSAGQSMYVEVGQIWPTSGHWYCRDYRRGESEHSTFRAALAALLAT